MKIAVLGTRGIPASYGGFETFAEELSKRLVRRGHQLTVFGRKRFGDAAKKEEYQGVTIIKSPTIFHKYLETPLASLSSFLMIKRRECDVAILCNAANSPFAWILRLKRIPVLINVDGIERKRAKWSVIGRWWYRLGEYCSVIFASKVVADAEVIANYYLERFNTKSLVIAYGAQPQPAPPGEVLARFGLQPRGYLLYVSRFEPENNALLTIRSYRDSGVKLPLVLVGDAPYAEEYKAQLRAAAAGADVIFTGYQFGAAYRELRTNCALYIQATEVGGTHPALVEAMAYGNVILANDCPEHREVLKEAGAYYKFNNQADMAAKLAELLADRALQAEYAAAAQRRAQEFYSWERITDQYEQGVISVVGGGS